MAVVGRHRSPWRRKQAASRRFSNFSNGVCCLFVTLIATVRVNEMEHEDAPSANTLLPQESTST
jgi:hypothetical protein